MNPLLSYLIMTIISKQKPSTACRHSSVKILFIQNLIVCEMHKVVARCRFSFLVKWMNTVDDDDCTYWRDCALSSKPNVNTHDDPLHSDIDERKNLLSPRKILLFMFFALSLGMWFCTSASKCRLIGFRHEHESFVTWSLHRK